MNDWIRCRMAKHNVEHIVQNVGNVIDYYGYKVAKLVA